MAELTFFPWTRPDASRLPADPLPAALPVSASMPIELTLSQNAPVTIEATLDGPGDVIALDTRQVTRMEPAPGTTNFEPDYFAAIEFAMPELPWLYTPASANAQDQLRPWLVLVVVRKQPGVSITPVPDQLPRLEVKSPARPGDELPDLANSWAWAHSQATAASTCSRLICPRELDDDQSYIACVVPAFDAGRRVAVGEPASTEKKLEPAWKQKDTSVVLPVYHSWEFATGADGHFESLVELLLAPKERAADEAQGKRVEAGGAGEGLPAVVTEGEASQFTLPSALVPPEAESVSNPDFVARFGAALWPMVLPAIGEVEPRLAPPVYGDQYAAKDPTQPAGTAPRWLEEINFNPQFRVVASFGAEVVRRNQERLVDSAWDQAGEIREANRLLRNSQAAAAANAAVQRRHFSRLSAEEKAEITRFLHGSIVVEGTRTLATEVAASANAAVFMRSEFLRATRVRGPIGRRAVPVEMRAVGRVLPRDWTGVLVGFMAAKPSTATPEDIERHYTTRGGGRSPGNPAVSFQQLRFFDVDAVSNRADFAIAPPRLPTGTPEFFDVMPPPPTGANTPAADNLKNAMREHQKVIRPVPVPILMVLPRAILTSAQIAAAALAPSITRFAQAAVRVGPDAGAGPDEQLNPVRMAPSFPEPLYAALGALSPDLVVQGFEAIPSNSITVLKTNPKFVEAFLTGANHEMARELVWREFPAYERATFFAQFWDTAGDATPDVPDVPPLKAWAGNAALGENSTTPALSVFLLRGELVRRYPTAIVYLVKAGAADSSGQPTLGTEEKYPAVRGNLAADAAFFGFAVPAEKISEWLFVLQEPASEPRFGAVTGGGPQGNSAQTARKHHRRPVRVAIHASDLLSHV